MGGGTVGGEEEGGWDEEQGEGRKREDGMRSSGRGRGRMELRRRGEEEDEKQIIAAITLHSLSYYILYILQVRTATSAFHSNSLFCQ